MPAADHETVRRVVAAFNDRDSEAMLRDVDREAELYPLRAQLEGKPYLGHEGARQMLSDMAEDWDYIRIAIDEIRESAEDELVVLCQVSSRGRASGMELEVPFAFHFRLRRGKVVYSKGFSDQLEALRAAGLGPPG